MKPVVFAALLMGLSAIVPASADTTSQTVVTPTIATQTVSTVSDAVSEASRSATVKPAE